jgi:isopentenyl diphosphate isomerase/L-lactate dehydrogenase-like FMN-dependent dehydrogenase
LTLLELHKYAPEVFGQLEIYVDGGITRGTDIMKALALGATSVGIGRPYIYALAYGEAGVQHLTESKFKTSLDKLVLTLTMRSSQRRITDSNETLWSDRRGSSSSWFIEYEHD